MQYLVKWKGYHELDNQWVNWDNMTADEALKEFQQQYPMAVTHIRVALTSLNTSMEFASTPSPPPQDFYEFTLPTRPASPATSASLPPSTFDDVLIANLRLATVSQEDLTVNLQSSHAQVGQLVEEVAQLFSQEGTD